jgi:hypothetical protein
MSPFALDALDPLLADRLRKLAGARGWSESDALRRAVERGLLAIEADVPARLEADEAEVLQAAIAALEQIPSDTFAAIGKLHGEPEGQAP